MPTAAEIVPGNIAIWGAEPMPCKSVTVVPIRVLLSRMTRLACRTPAAIGEKVIATEQAVELQASGVVSLKSDAPRSAADGVPESAGIGNTTEIAAELKPTATVPKSWLTTD